MPYPIKKETRKEFLKRFLESEEAKRDYPDVKQRIAVAYQIYKDRNKS